MALVFHANCLHSGQLHKVSTPIFWSKKQEQYFKLSSAEIFYQPAKCLQVNINTMYVGGFTSYNTALSSTYRFVLV